MAVWRCLLSAAAFVMLAGWVAGVSAQEYFGKNKVTYDGYDWHYIETEHFTIYFDRESLPVAEFAAKEAERALAQIEKDLKYTLKGRYPFVVYNSHNGFSVTNISPQEIPDGVGGFTEFAQGRIVIPYTGSYADFRHVIHHELVHEVTVEMWTGGGLLGGVVAQTASIPPLWVVEGVAEYLSRGGWDIGADNFMRDATITGYAPPIELLGGLFAYKGGQSVMYMIEQTYGKEKVAEFISNFRSARSVDKALKSSVGIGLEELDEKWQLWLKRQFWNDINLYQHPEEVGKNLTKPAEQRTYFGYNLAPSFSPQRDKIAYQTLSSQGTFNLRLMSAIDGKDLGRLVEGERSSDFESMFLLRPGVTWSPDGKQIAFAAKSNNKNTLYILEVRRKKVRKRFKFDLDGLFEPAWSPDGKRIAVVGLKHGWSDIYIVNLDDESLERITNDPYDEKQLDWSPDGAWIAMSSDRPDTALAFDGQKDFPFGQYDIFVVRPDGSEIRRVVAHEAGEVHPSWGGDSETLAFVSDRTGVGNIYIAHLDSGVVYPVTNLLAGGQGVDWHYMDWSADGKKMAFTSLHKAGYDIFVMSDPLSKRKRAEDLPLTRFAKREQGIEDKTFVERQQERQKQAQASQGEGEGESIELAVAPEDTGVVDRKVEKWVSDQMSLATEEAKSEAGEAVEAPSDSSAVEAPPDSSAGDGEGLGATLEGWNKEFKINKYKIKLKPEFFGANAGFDTFYGVSSLVQLSMSDVLGDHRLVLLTSVNFSLKDSDFFLTYANLKRQTNFAVQAFHTRLFFFSGGVLNADRYYGGAAGLERPFNRFTRFELGTRFITISRDRLNSFANPFVRGGFTGGTVRGQPGEHVDTRRAVISEAALVDDNTMNSLFGPVHGRRLRLSFEGSFSGMKYRTVQLDYRKYVRVLDDYTFGLRLAGGTSFGQNRHVFFVGGVNNPINPRFSTIASVDDSRIFFSRFIWPLRGVELFEMAGDSFALANVAFRFPLLRQLTLGWPLPLFFQNVQGELFLDVGGAFDRDNFDPWEAQSGGFELRDLEAGYGLGVRVNMGIFLFRYDLAWPTDFAQTYHPLQYFSIDFTGIF